MLRPRTVREGSVGLFALLGLIVLGGVAIWLRGGGFGTPSYRIFVDFDDASGLQVGAPVRFRGVAIGKIVALSPSSNGIEAALDIASTQLKIPRDSLIQVSRYGLIGEASIDIMPQRKLTKKELALNPTSQDCLKLQQIFCHNERFQGEAGAQLMTSLTQLSKVYSNPEFVGNLNSTARNAALAANRIARMSDEIALLSKTARYQISGVSNTTKAIAGAAHSANQLTQNLNQIVSLNQSSISKTIRDSAQLMQNLNLLVLENRSHVTQTLTSIQGTSQEIQNLSRRLEGSVQLLDKGLVSVNRGLNAIDTDKLAKNLEIVLNNAAETSKNLQEISKQFNDPTILLTIQKTLDSARVTFENTQKITSDVEQVTGDPTFRNNLRKLVDGLGNLVSSTEALQQQLYADQMLKNTSLQLQYQIDVQQRLVLWQNPRFANPSAPATVSTLPTTKMPTAEVPARSRSLPSASPLNSLPKPPLALNQEGSSTTLTAPNALPVPSEISQAASPRSMARNSRQQRVN